MILSFGPGKDEVGIVSGENGLKVESQALVPLRGTATSSDAGLLQGRSVMASPACVYDPLKAESAMLTMWRC